MLTRLWHDPVWSKVIAAGIFAALCWFTGSFFNWWSWSTFVNAVKSDARWVFFRRSPVPNWLIAVGGLVLLLVIIVVIVFIIVAVRNGDARNVGQVGVSRPALAWHSYTTDVLRGVRWRWSYGVLGNVENLACFCPRCDYQLSVVNLSFTRTGVALHCDICNCDIARFDGDFAYVKSIIVRLMQQKIRTGNWVRADGGQGL